MNHRGDRTGLTDGQLWFILIAGFILALLIIGTIANATGKGCS